jgi:alkaline phosphatase
VAKALGMATGLITTTSIVDATPAAFASHVRNRGMFVDIFRQMTQLPVDVILGGGRGLFNVALSPASANLLKTAKRQYSYVETAEQLEQIVPHRVSKLLGLFSRGDMPRAPGRSPALTDMLKTALAVLDGDPEGFFLMVENEGSDTEAHGKVPRDVLVAEMLDFDDAIRAALDYQAGHPGTLIVVTADHETGGISLTPDTRRDAVLKYATSDHTAALVPLFAKGPGAARFGGLKENWEIGLLLIDAVKR